MKINFENKEISKCNCCHKRLSYGEELCEYCYKKFTKNLIIKNINGLWQNNITEVNKKFFYNDEKMYYLKDKLMTDNEFKLFNYTKNFLNKDYILLPQVNLQAIIDTYQNSYRNDELFRNIDYVIFDKSYTPLLAIELNDPSHYTNPEKITRDESVKSILEVVSLPLIIIKNEDLENLNMLHNYKNNVLNILNAYIKKD